MSRSVICRAFCGLTRPILETASVEQRGQLGRGMWYCTGGGRGLLTSLSRLGVEDAAEHLALHLFLLCCLFFLVLASCASVGCALWPAKACAVKLTKRDQRRAPLLPLESTQLTTRTRSATRAGTATTTTSQLSHASSSDSLQFVVFHLCAMRWVGVGSRATGA